MFRIANKAKLNLSKLSRLEYSIISIIIAVAGNVCFNSFFKHSLGSRRIESGLKHAFSTACACRKRRLNGEHGPSDEAVKPEASCQQEWHDKDPSVSKGRGCPALP